MVVAPDGTVAGSVSGGCVEAAVYELANEVVASGRPELQRYGVTDDDAFAVGLTCGGIIDIFAEPMSRDTFPQLEAIADDIAAHRPTAVATVIAHPDPRWIGRRLVIGQRRGRRDRSARRGPTPRSPTTRAACLPPGRTTVLSYGPDGQRQDSGMEVFVASHAPRPRMLIFGAIDFAAALAAAGRVPGLSRHRVRRAAGVRHPGPIPWRRRGGRRLARPLPRRAGRTGRHRLAAPRSACSPTTPSSTSPSCRSRCGCPRSATSA